MIFCSLFSFYLKSQSVILSNANYFTNNKASVSYTLGDVFVGSFNNGNIILDQGFNAINSLDYISSIEVDQVFIDIKAYPNPVTDLLCLSIDSYSEDLSYAIINIQGQVMSQNHIQDYNTTIDFTNYSLSVYLLRISDKHGVLKSFTIIKK